MHYVPRTPIAVYSLTGGISELQSFTSDKRAATLAVLRAEVGGMTALYDGLVQVAGRTGKKVIVVFTDGEDNISTLTAETAAVRAKAAGVSIYLHGYLLAFQPPALEDHAWRTIQVVLRSPRGRTVRAREGYYPE